MYYGIPPEPDLGVVIEEENEEEDDKDKPKVRTFSNNYILIQNRKFVLNEQAYKIRLDRALFN